jgi:alkylation response protein AidB-like acyl-CoA dehydrogenase
MNFDLSDDQRLLRDLVRDFSRCEIAPNIAAYEDQHIFPREIIQKLAELGVLGMTVPAEFGGTQTDHLSFILALEELGRVSASVCVIVAVHGSLFAKTILDHGTARQKDKYLARAARGEVLGGYSVTEPGSGSDAAGLKTRAVRSGSEYVLNGTKAWVTNGSAADALILLSQTELPDGSAKPSAFIVEKGFPGFRVAKVEDKMGLHASVTAEIVLEDCRVPAENLLGDEGRGLAIALHSLEGSRIGIAAQSVGLAQSALELAVRYARQREQFGRPIADFQAVQFMIADMAVQVEAARLLTYRAADACGRGLSYAKEAAMAKLYASETANRVASLGLQIHGAYGYSKEYTIERLFREARVFSIYEGTSEIQRIIIAKTLLRET